MTPLDLVTSSLRAVGAVPAGETPTPAEANDAFDLLNMLLDQLSNEKQMVFCVQEVIHELTVNQIAYSIGAGGDIGAAFTGTIAGNVLTVSALASGALSVGQAISATFASSGVVTGVAAATTGIGYVSLPSVSFAGGGGAGAGATLTLTCVGVPVSWSSGAGYAIGDLVTLVGGTFTRAATVRILAPGTFDVVDGGAYTVLPGTVGAFGGLNTTGDFGTIPVTGGTGAGLQLLATWGLGTPVLATAGSGYSSAPAATVVGGGANVAGTVTATITSTALTSVLSGTAITALGTALGGNGSNALGTYYVNLPQTGGPVSMTSAQPRPLRINSAFARVVNSATGTLDYPVNVLNVEDYERIGIKTQAGPWPRALYYQPSEPVGKINYWPSPSTVVEMHLFCDTVLNRFNSLSETVRFPQGYEMGLRWMLAEILMPEYPATAAAAETRAMIPMFARQARAYIKRMNMQPMGVVQFEPMLTQAKKNDAGFILNGGFN